MFCYEFSRLGFLDRFENILKLVSSIRTSECGGDARSHPSGITRHTAGGFNRDMKEDGGNKESQEDPDHLPGFFGGMGASICQLKSGC
jgi:hypothetical protein